ncbi:hypothetical protein [Jiella marina]|uniref:hypothetical protein n=1 Tax=Jiella sp. LLJ827 TaxID=2917712 RepID=UPI002100F4E7|nr:hypothetical protein [Jiella sp. LLJ827]MCQ0987561.1 hypothetical protein [Jiella sp. LLJ827]
MDKADLAMAGLRGLERERQALAGGGLQFAAHLVEIAQEELLSVIAVETQKKPKAREAAE